jgi:hypothetical protein
MQIRRRGEGPDPAGLFFRLIRALRNIKRVSDFQTEKQASSSNICQRDQPEASRDRMCSNIKKTNRGRTSEPTELSERVDEPDG